MRLVYFENDRGDAISLVAHQIVGIQQNRLPTDTPTTVMLLDGQAFRVRNGFDECQQKLMAAAQLATSMTVEDVFRVSKEFKSIYSLVPHQEVIAYTRAIEARCGVK